MRVVWVAVVVACLFTLWARYPADAFGCTKVQGYVQTFGRDFVFRRALDFGYTRAQISRFRAHCRRQGINL